MDKARADTELDRVKLKEEVVELKGQIKELKHGSLVEKRRFDEKAQAVVALELQLKRVQGSSTKQQKEIQGAMDSVTQYRRQVV